MGKHRRTPGKRIVDFAAGLKERLSKEEIEFNLSAATVDVPKGHLAIIYTLDVPDTSPNQRLRMERIAKEECIKYLQHNRKTGR